MMSLLQRCWLVVIGVWPLEFSDHAAGTALRIPEDLALLSFIHLGCHVVAKHILACRPML
jgi:hypothetical protein